MLALIFGAQIRCTVKSRHHQSRLEDFPNLTVVCLKDQLHWAAPVMTHLLGCRKRPRAVGRVPQAPFSTCLMVLVEHSEVTKSLLDPSAAKVADNLERSGPSLVLIFLCTKSQALLFWHAPWPTIVVFGLECDTKDSGDRRLVLLCSLRWPSWSDRFVVTAHDNSLAS